MSSATHSLLLADDDEDELEDEEVVVVVPVVPLVFIELVALAPGAEAAKTLLLALSAFVIRSSVIAFSIHLTIGVGAGPLMEKVEVVPVTVAVSVDRTFVPS